MISSMLLYAIIIPLLLVNLAETAVDLLLQVSSMNNEQISNFISLAQSSSETSDVTKQSFKKAFLSYYPKFVLSIHQHPYFCQWLFAGDAIGWQTHCPRPIGLEINPYDINDPYKIKISLDYGFIARDRLELVDLTNLRTLHQYCPDNISYFTSCQDDLKSIKLLMSPDRSDMIPWSMRRAVVIGGKQAEASGSIIGGIHPELSRPFAPHLVAVKNAFVSAWGYIFDFERWYIHGGCPDRAWHHPTFDYDLSTHPVVSFNEPILSLLHPFPSMFYHEYIEMHAMLLMSLPLLKANPNITILINKPLVFTKLFPLLLALDIDLNNYNIISMKLPQANKKVNRRVNMDASTANKLKGSIVYAPYIVTPISLWCQYISRSTTLLMRQQYAKHLSYWNQPGAADTIIVYDRYNLRPKRFLIDGDRIYQSLIERYGNRRSVKMFYGNESLEETVSLFRSSNVFIAAHGGGQANMIFMPEGGIVVEVRPENWPVPCYIDIADNLNLQHYLSIAKDVGRVGEMHLELSSFLPILYSLIDNIPAIVKS